MGSNTSLNASRDASLTRDLVNDSTAPTAPDACLGCSARRDFLRSAAASVLVGLSLGPLGTLQALEHDDTSSGARGTIKYPIPAADGASIDTKNEVILCRAGADVFAFALSCPHQNTALKVLSKNRGFQCPKHKSKYEPNGTFIEGRATRNMDRLPVTRDGNLIVVDVDVAIASDTDAARWAAAVVHV
jgi:nitrite reductase/ring-hydroxylating ferredoxin subunit